MSFSPEFLDELRERVRLSDLIGRKVKLIRRGREHTGLCPFHSEKSPSFTVNDDKAFYHCFGCGAHGDAIRFLTDSEGLPFRDAVTRLAGEAGLELPAANPEAARRAERRASLHDVNEAAAKWFESQLHAASGRDALGYLRRRGLSDEIIRQFRLGYAPPARTALKEALLARGLDIALIEESGVLITPDGERGSFDRFRNRVMFPIVDNRGRVAAFGGRALDDAPAKYLNSPETPLFHKGRMLYNLAQARAPARERGLVVVVEGYMDVISLAEAGLPNAVAPLGTALTEDQMQELWRVVPEPVLCFDGDNAGRRAAARAIERALPHLKPGHSLRFALMPQGEDPDDFVRAKGAESFTSLLSESPGLAQMLWETLLDGHQTDTPERRAGFEQAVGEALARISDGKVRKFYEAEFRSRLGALFAPPAQARGQGRGQVQGGRARGGYGGQNGGRGAGNRPRGAFSGFGRFAPEMERASSRLRATALAREDASVKSRLREGLLLLCVVNHPSLLDGQGEELMALEIKNRDLDKLRGEIIRIAATEADLDTGRLRAHLMGQGFGSVMSSLDAALAPVWFVGHDAALVDVERGWRHAFGLHQHFLMLERELKQVENQLADELSEEAFARLQALLKELEEAEGREANLAGFGVASGRKEAV